MLDDITAAELAEIEREAGKGYMTAPIPSLRLIAALRQNRAEAAALANALARAKANLAATDPNSNAHILLTEVRHHLGEVVEMAAGVVEANDAEDGGAFSIFMGRLRIALADAKNVALLARRGDR